MRNLQHFSPAEAFLILYPKRASRNDLLKATLYDLMMKGVLKTHIESTSYKSGLSRNTRFIIAGRSLSGYHFLPHEGVFLDPYLKNNRIKLSMESLTKGGFDRSNGEKWYKWNALIAQHRMSNFFKTSFFHKLFGIASLNEEGKKLQAQLFREIAHFEKELRQFRQSNKTKADELVENIGGCVILLGNFKSNLLNEIDAHLQFQYDEMVRKQDEGGSNWGNGDFDFDFD